MTTLVHRRSGSMQGQVTISPGGGLWRYAPATDIDGQPVCDLMMLLSGVKRGVILSILIRHQLQEVLEGFGKRVLFADLNIRLGILWITVASEPGLCGEVADAIRARIEGARVVGNYVPRSKQKRLSWQARVKRLLK